MDAAMVEAMEELEQGETALWTTTTTKWLGNFS
jgi:hypothetical protein